MILRETYQNTRKPNLPTSNFITRFWFNNQPTSLETKTWRGPIGSYSRRLGTIMASFGGGFGGGFGDGFGDDALFGLGEADSVVPDSDDEGGFDLDRDDISNVPSQKPGADSFDMSGLGGSLPDGGLGGIPGMVRLSNYRPFTVTPSPACAASANHCCYCCCCCCSTLPPLLSSLTCAHFPLAQPLPRICSRLVWRTLTPPCSRRWRD